MVAPIIVSVIALVTPARTLTRRYREVVDFTRSRVKTKSKLTNLMKLTRIEGHNGK